MTFIDLRPTLERMIEPLYVRLRKLENGGFQPPALDADPAVLTDGMLWYRTDLGEFRARVSGVTKTVDLT